MHKELPTSPSGLGGPQDPTVEVDEAEHVQRVAKLTLQPRYQMEDQGSMPKSLHNVCSLQPPMPKEALRLCRVLGRSAREPLIMTSTHLEAQATRESNATAPEEDQLLHSGQLPSARFRKSGGYVQRRGCCLTLLSQWSVAVPPQSHFRVHRQNISWPPASG